LSYQPEYEGINQPIEKEAEISYAVRLGGIGLELAKNTDGTYSILLSKDKAFIASAHGVTEQNLANLGRILAYVRGKVKE
jgi:hypothetical protein